MSLPAPLFDPADFRIPPGVAHVCAAGETPFLHRHDAALRRYAEDKSRGAPGRDGQEAVIRRARAAVARAWGAGADEIGFCANVAEGVSLLVESIDWRPGDSVVLDPDEYPSLVGPLLLHRRPSIALRFARADDPAAMAAAVDGGTRLVAVSHVSYLNAARHDLAALREVADSVGALLVVDHTQAAGWAPIRADLADFAFSACYKWMLGITGTCVAYWNRARQPDWAPASAGWHSLVPAAGAASGAAGILGARPDYAAGVALVPDAMRFARGNPAHLSLYVLDSALDYLAGFEPAAVQAHVQALTVGLLARLAAAGIPSITPADPARHGASVCIASPNAAALVRALGERGVLAWNGRGRIRISFHGYNGAADVERIMAALREVWPG
ncbi:aminotransferase class V-fold PLP-dependent enzyme [Roseomonas sp. NAR14]|uniref:Aminotransferase class V-fold PLP-dependent enzyme n=1 Tax=Roseomonas acroporae TaxID=2937791 RepID=A0A9X1YC62_9PROT|nr:aminotransferase class V-fold PLP-dependent enzyme [Roseomonas acroporae]MCK8787431.1 aminotransferase class V-fold PLP-dependent enzyme [Roseomonas acroporae]